MSAWALSLLFLLSGHDYTGTTIEALPLGGSVQLLRVSAPMTNPSAVALMTSQGTLLVDPGLHGTADYLKATLKDLEAPAVRYVLNTHPHGDHTLGNEAFGADAVVVARGQLRVRAQEPGLFGPDSPPMKAVGLPDMTVEHLTTLYLGDEVVEILPLGAGHTDGDLAVYFKQAKVLVVGDYYFLDRWPIIDLSSGGSMAGYLDNIEGMLERFPEDAKVVPGHSTFAPDEARVGTMAEWRAWQRLLRGSIDYIVAKRSAGMSLEDLVKEGLPEQYTPLGSKPRFVSEARWIEAVYENRK